MRLSVIAGCALLALLLVATWIIGTWGRKHPEAGQESLSIGTLDARPTPSSSGTDGRAQTEPAFDQRFGRTTQAVQSRIPVVPVAPKPQERGLLANLRSSEPIRKIEAAGEIIAKPSSELVRALLEETSRCEDATLRQKLLDDVRMVDGARYAELLVGAMLTPKNGDLRKAAADALVRSSSPEAVHELISGAQSVTDAEPLLREIGRTLSRFQGPQAVAELLRGIDSELPAVQAGCVAALAEIGTADIGNTFFSKYQASEGLRREMIIEGFSRFRNPQVAQTLERIAQETTDPKLKNAIAGALNRTAADNTETPK